MTIEKGVVDNYAILRVVHALADKLIRITNNMAVTTCIESLLPGAQRGAAES